MTSRRSMLAVTPPTVDVTGIGGIDTHREEET